MIALPHHQIKNEVVEKNGNDGTIVDAEEVHLIFGMNPEDVRQPETRLKGDGTFIMESDKKKMRLAFRQVDIKKSFSVKNRTIRKGDVFSVFLFDNCPVWEKLVDLYQIHEGRIDLKNKTIHGRRVVFERKSGPIDGLGKTGVEAKTIMWNKIGVKLAFGQLPNGSLACRVCQNFHDRAKFDRTIGKISPLVKLLPGSMRHCLQEDKGKENTAEKDSRRMKEAGKVVLSG